MIDNCLRNFVGMPFVPFQICTSQVLFVAAKSCEKRGLQTSLKINEKVSWLLPLSLSPHAHPDFHATHGEKLKYRPFWGSPLFYKAPPREFQPPRCKLTPSKIQIVGGRFLCISIQKLQIGGRQFTVWRVSI